jgi:hypothetical protein
MSCQHIYNKFYSKGTKQIQHFDTFKAKGHILSTLSQEILSQNKHFNPYATETSKQFLQIQHNIYSPYFVFLYHETDTDPYFDSNCICLERN